ncbi:MAG TPA: TIGR03067 domain-containing protein [Gemmataceae bacterium]|jgi:uncharacterized protein (TIGR03067 family)|nr:TIGR03067 domain-containing protein [Gemmataceae bacterium]
MARFWPIAWMLFLATANLSAAPALKDPPPKEPAMFGEWLRVGHTEAGMSVAPDHEAHHQMFSPDGGWEYTYGGRQGSGGGKSFVINPRQSPATIDIHMGPVGRVPANWRGIYKVEGDTLTLCLVTGDRDRPKEFESTADKPTTIWVFRRVKGKD